MVDSFSSNKIGGGGGGKDEENIKFIKIISILFGFLIAWNKAHYITHPFSASTCHLMI